ncbi:MAG TPA: hypothetical protein DDZ80_14975 [Cyanobacteria bacterium UBA8803]|nr:hypothetical protein [Cyanobacteria bacterium UBA9273]HBL59731.1 hypothetical protein [Cyanobacteria bacterium UBA8803]
MPKYQEDQTLIGNKFGTITNHQVIFSSDKNLFSSGSRKEIPLHQISSVRFYKQKSWIAIIAGTLGLLLPFLIKTLFFGSLMGKITAFIVLVLGIGIAYLGLAGFPTIVITTATGTVTQARGWPQDKSEAKAFALILREKIIV